jgi:hypothetical protein
MYTRPTLLPEAALPPEAVLPPEAALPLEARLAAWGPAQLNLYEPASTISMSDNISIKCTASIPLLNLHQQNYGSSRLPNKLAMSPVRQRPTFLCNHHHVSRCCLWRSVRTCHVPAMQDRPRYSFAPWLSRP